MSVVFPVQFVRWGRSAAGWLLRFSIILTIGGWIWSAHMVNKASASTALPTTTAIEILEFRIPVERQAEFIKRDEKIWGAALKQQPGFLYRQVWSVPDAPDRVKIAIYWASREQWKAFPTDLQSELDRQMQPFDSALVNVEEYALHPLASSTTISETKSF
ncbi:MAG: TIGR03792 family protein [Cyanobacteria bacterium P01_F01_bin.33]